MYDLATNEGWPEAFGFSVSGDSPVVISAVEEGGSAQGAGLQTGDVIEELDGEHVQQWSRAEVVLRAKRAAKVPPSLVVISRVRRFDIPRGNDGGFGITLRGDSPVFIRSVDFHSPARAAGVRSGDLLLELNGVSVRYSSKLEVLEGLKRTGRVLRLVVIASGLGTSWQGLGGGNRGEKRYNKARDFHQKVNYFLMHDETKRPHLLTLLRLYAGDKNVDSLGASLNILLETPIERRLLPDIRDFLHPTHQGRFDVLVSYTPSTKPPLRRASHDLVLSGPRPLAAVRDAPWRSSLPNLASGERRVTVSRGRAGFGFSLSGNAPVFIRAVDSGGAAARVGLRAGDHILELNGLNVRKSTHSHVVRLLKGSGTRPSLLVASVPPEGDRQQQGEGGGRRGSVSSLSGVLGARDIRKTSTAFKHKMEQILLQDERQSVIQQLTKFSQHKSLQQLVEGLGEVLNDPNKMVIFHYICQLLPGETQAEFDRIASAAIAGDPTTVVGSSHAPEGVGDLLYRVQGDRLSKALAVSPRRRISTSHFSPARRGGATPGVGVAEGGELDVGGAGDFERGEELMLEDTPIRHTSGVGVARGGGGGEGLVLEDTPIRHVRQDESPGEGGSPEASTAPERLPPEERRALRGKRESLENTPVGQNLSKMLGGGESGSGTPQRRTSREAPPTDGRVNESSILSPGVPAPPPPPPTPQGGVGGIPVPPPPPPTVPTGVPLQSHLKRANWEKLHGTEGTIWRELSGLEEALEYCELEKKFANQKPASKAKAKDKQQLAILEPRKAYNIAILLGHLKLPFDRIREAIITCDDSTLSEQHLKQLLAFAPNKKECLGFARYYDNPSALTPPDRFSCEMSTIPFYQERLKAMIFRTHFTEKVEVIKPDLEAICLASVQLQSSKSFKRVLEIVLAVGNYMNAGNMKVGGAVGFRIRFLTQLQSLRTTDNQSSLLHFLANTLERKFPNVLTFPSDLTYISKAARVSGQTLEVEIRELSQGVKDIRKDLRELARLERVPGDRFEDVMTAFLSETDSQMSDLLRLHSRMKQEYLQVVRFFGEDPGKMRIDDFFGTFASFITDFEKAIQENRRLREQEALKEKRIREREELAKRRSQKVTSKLLPDLRRGGREAEPPFRETNSRAPPLATAREGGGERGAERREGREVEPRLTVTNIRTLPPASVWEAGGRQGKEEPLRGAPPPASMREDQQRWSRDEELRQLLPDLELEFDTETQF